MSTRPDLRARSVVPPAGTDASDRDRTVGLLAAEAAALVRQACSTRVGMRALQQMAAERPDLLDAAAERCNRAGDLDHRVRAIAIQLLQRAAADIRLDRRQPQTGTIRT